MPNRPGFVRARMSTAQALEGLHFAVKFVLRTIPTETPLGSKASAVTLSPVPTGGPEMVADQAPVVWFGYTVHELPGAHEHVTLTT